MSDQFDGPGSASGITWADLNGRLLLITPHEKDVMVNTAFGENSAVRADVVVLDGPDAGEEYADTLIFPKVLQGQVKGNAGTGRMNLGRLGQGQKKPGQSAPWMLGDPTDADKEVARRYLASKTQAPF
ncbi:hypothetical protein OU415_02490 [Saccharopolyspora sp. WRP15-2]|uniref:Uncharacterized protein n=1 Tax=Saccharopolyspora oryzae TaxID=2997343 RepID=A0ABT4USP7_9PSEU|nr:hypothetical protein [Saccharopolyspora oryzae]MDA3624286.1 hypothetical protein [Saccharopolyspora oryzae]